jgi:hypothetical protein
VANAAVLLLRAAIQAEPDVCCELEGELIRHYGEIFERAPALAQLGFSDERILKAVKRWAAAL